MRQLRHRCIKWKKTKTSYLTSMRLEHSAAWWRGLATFVYVVEVGLLTHGGQEVQDIGVDADLVVTVVLPGIVLDHVEKLPDKKQDSMFRMILVENQNRENTLRYKQEKKSQHRNAGPSL